MRAVRRAWPLHLIGLASALAGAWLVLASGCAGDDGGVRASPTVSDVNDAGDRMAFDTFTVADQGAIATTGTIGGAVSHGVRIVLGSGGLFCGGTGLAGDASMELHLSTTAASLLPSTYPITNGTGTTTQIDAVFQLIDAQCSSLARHPAQSGSITITSIDAASVKGTFDIVFGGFGSTGRALGGFVAPFCSAAQWGPHANCMP